MAYRNLVGINCASKAELFKRMRDFICRRNGSYDYSTTGIGWTLFDSSYAVNQDTISTNDWIVIYSPGESGNDDLYFRMRYISGFIVIEGFLYWDAAANTGVQQYNSTSNFTVGDSDVPVLWVYGDLDSVFLIERPTTGSATFNPAPFGKVVNTLYPQDVYATTNSVTAGAGVTINFASVPSSWKAGQKLFIRNNASIEMFTISSIGSGSIVASSLATSYSSGAKVAADVGYFAPTGGTMGSTGTLLINHVGTKSVATSAWTYMTTPSFGSPENLNQDHIITPYLLTFTNEYYGELKNVYRRNNGTSMTDLNVYPDVSDGAVNYRCFTVTTGHFIAVKEVT